MTVPRVRLVVIGLTALSLLGGLIFVFTSPRATSGRGDPASAEGGEAAPASSEASVRVVAQTVQKTEDAATVDVTGLIEPVRSVVVAAEVEGVVIEVPVEEHSRVEAGDVLVRLDPVFLEVAVQRARAAVQSAKASDELAQLELLNLLALRLL